jgi:hypothetical protein
MPRSCRVECDLIKQSDCILARFGKLDSQLVYSSLTFCEPITMYVLKSYPRWSSGVVLR